jgi:hypothetical protein
MNMAVQMNYGEPKAGMPGGLVDRSNYSAVTRRNGADTGKMLFGLGVVQGEEPGTDIALPATGATASKFEGVTMYSANVEMDDEGKVKLPKGGVLDVLQAGKVYVQVADDADPAYGKAVYLIISGDDAGKFTAVTSVAVKAKFLGAADDGLAPAQFYDMPQA